MNFARILIRATNWVGDAVMSLAAVHTVRTRFPQARLIVLARPPVAGLYERESSVDEVIRYDAGRLATARRVRSGEFDCALLLQNAFDAALITWLAGVPHRVGYRRDLRGPLLTHAVPAPRRGEIPRHQRFYYLELLRRAGWIDDYPHDQPIRLDRPEAARDAGRAAFDEAGIRGDVIGVSPGAAYGGAKRWLPERFAEAAGSLARKLGASVALFGARAEKPLCDGVAGHLASSGVQSRNFAGETTLVRFIEMAAACRLFLTNDSGAMHVASALDVPTVAVFGATDHEATGPAGPRVRVVRQPVDCSPCLLRECPIDHRCMTRVTAPWVAAEALTLLK